MKKFYVAAAFLALGLGSKAQVLLTEDFQGDLTNISVSYPSVLTTDPSWYDYDEDGLADGSGASRPNEWFAAYAFAFADSLTGLGDTNVVMASNSWTNNFTTSVRNWLVSPNVMIPSGATSAVLKFKTAPYQTPLYCDGFTVRVSTTDNDLGSFSAPLFFGAEYSDEGGAYPSYGGDWASYEYKNPYTNAVVSPSSSFVHGWDGSTHQMTEIEAGSDSSRWIGILTENTLNLGAYIGQNIFFAIIHETHDDNYFSVDDISVEVVTGIDVQNAITKINTYPNPTVDLVTVEYTSASASAAAILTITDVQGRIIATQSLGMMNEGVNKIQIDATGFANGTYNIDIKTDKGLGKVSFIKI